MHRNTSLSTTLILLLSLFAALGAQAGEAKLREVVVDQGGFASLRRAAATPLNLVLEARAT